MAKRPNTQETLIFALELLHRIPRNRKVTASQLREQLEDAGLKRDLRSIQRQLEALSQHFDIERDDRDKPYGYRWKERAKGWSLPRLTEHESLLLTLAEEYLHDILPASLMKSMVSFFEQAKYNLSVSGKELPAREWLDKVRIVRENQPLLPPKLKDGIFEKVSNALYTNKWLTVKYRRPDGYEHESRVMPLGLAQQGPRLYLVVRFEGYDNERSLALHRILSAEVSSLTFERPKEFNLQKYDNDGRFGFGDGREIKLSFNIDKGAGFHITESPLSEDQKVTEYEEYYQIEASVVDSHQLDWWLMTFGEDVWDIDKS